MESVKADWELMSWFAGFGREEEKALRRQRKNPGLFFPPFSTPADPVTGIIAPQNRSQAQKPTMPHQPVSWMMMPTLEEFGIRRPFDAPGRPSGVGGPSGQGQWPMMSRTMTHVSSTDPSVQM